MKRVLRLLTLAGAVAGAVWYARQHAEPQAAAPTGEWKPRPQLRAVPDPVGPAPAETEAETVAPDQGATPDDLTEIKGIGPKYSSQLNELGITTMAGLAAADPAQLAEQFDPRASVEDWVNEAKGRLED